jgi:hypothetical protein
MALTQLPAVEPLRWGLRGVAAQCFVVNSIFKYYYGPNSTPMQPIKIKRLSFLNFLPFQIFFDGNLNLLFDLLPSHLF